MALIQSPHLTDIPQAIRIAASGDTSIDPALKQQAFEYLTKVKELAEETWQVGSFHPFSDSYLVNHQIGRVRPKRDEILTDPKKTKKLNVNGS